MNALKQLWASLLARLIVPLQQLGQGGAGGAQAQGHEGDQWEDVFHFGFAIGRCD